VDAALVRQLIEAGLPGARVAVQGDDGVHFEAEVVSEAFSGKLPLTRHRMVYARPSANAWAEKSTRFRCAR
jgi:acid stress-induced BolA-like protein IbaG/YrbA